MRNCEGRDDCLCQTNMKRVNPSPKLTSYGRDASGVLQPRYGYRERTTSPRRQCAAMMRRGLGDAASGLRLRNSRGGGWGGVVGQGEETTSSEKQRGKAPVGNVCACASRAGPLGRSGHHLGTGGGAELTGSDRAGRRRRHEPRIVSEPRPRRPAQPRSRVRGCTLTGVVRPGSGRSGAPTSGSLFR